MMRTMLDLVQPYSVSSLRHQREQSRERAERLGLEKRSSRMFQREVRWWREAIVSVIVCGGLGATIGILIATSG